MTIVLHLIQRLMKSKIFGLFALSLLFLASCDKDDDDDMDIPNEEEEITTLEYRLTPDGGGTDLVFRFQDLDGDGGDPPVITLDTLAANTTYNGVIRVLNENETPTENVTEEVLDEDEEHQFFFQALDAAVITGITYSDMDENMNPVGVESQLQTGDAGSTELTVTLIHEPDKDAAGVSDGDPANAGGETDVEVTFSVVVE